MLCSQCGSENRPEAHYCRQCGQLLVADEVIDPDQDWQTDLVIPPGPGRRIQERFEIQQIIEVEADEQRFILEALDLAQCWNCGFLHSVENPSYCDNCGAEMTTKPGVLLQAVPLEGVPEDQKGSGFIETGYLYTVEKSLNEHKSFVDEHLPFRLVHGFQSHPGLVREDNEDSLIALQFSGLNHSSGVQTLGLYAIADGVGGSALGEIASQAAVNHLAASLVEQVFSQEFLGEPVPDDELPGVLEKAVLRANQAIVDLQNEREEGNMGSTLTALLIRNHQALVANIGDSRTYLMNKGVLKVVTRDHSLVARLVEQGVIEPQEAYTHRHRSVIYRSLGNKNTTEIDLFRLELERGDRLLLCSDGLWEMVHDPLLEEVLLDRQDPQLACDRLVELANQSGGDDNISVIVVDVQ